MPDLHSRDHHVRRHYSARYVRHAAGHNGEQLRLRQVSEKWADRQGCFRLAHEDARSDVRRFGSARAHDLLHADRHAPDNHLHDTQVVQNRE